MVRLGPHTVITFVIIAFSVFMIVKAVNSLNRAKAVAPEAPAAAPIAEEAPAEEPAASPAAPAPKTAMAKAGGPLPTTTAEKIAWCRSHDSKA